MDVLLNEDEELLREALRRFFESECDLARVRANEDDHRACDLGLWEQLAELGWLGLALPAAYGGADAPFTQLELLFEEAGRALAPVPLHPHTVAALTIAAAGSERQRETLLAPAASGEQRLCWAMSEGHPGLGPGTIRLRAEPEGNGWRLNGTKHFVDGFEGASQCLVVARNGPSAQGISVFVVDTGATGIAGTKQRTLAGDDQATVTFTDVRVSGDDVLGTVGEGWPVAAAMFERAVVLNCAMVVGATRRAAERAFDYAKEREAFGHPIGTFQAIQHMCANIITWVDGAELLTREAAWRIAQGLDATAEVAAAKAFTNERCQAALREANQIHGGVAQVREYDQQLWYRRAAAWTMRLGTAIEHRRALADTLLPG